MFLNIKCFRRQLTLCLQPHAARELQVGRPCSLSEFADVSEECTGRVDHASSNKSVRVFRRKGRDNRLHPSARQSSGNMAVAL
jgi:hypothetical protein